MIKFVSQFELIYTTNHGNTGITNNSITICVAAAISNNDGPFLNHPNSLKIRQVRCLYYSIRYTRKAIWPGLRFTRDVTPRTYLQRLS